MTTLIKPMLAKLALITTLLGGAEYAMAGHVHPPAVRVRINVPTCNTNIHWHGRAVHRHSFRIVYEKVWFGPVYEVRVVGYTSCGKPITKKVCVTHGHYKTAVYKVCGCDKKEFLHYL